MVNATQIFLNLIEMMLEDALRSKSHLVISCETSSYPQDQEHAKFLKN